MIGKRWQSMWNLAKARLGDPWRDGHFVYCCDDKTAKTKQSVGLACKAIHRSDRLPWPRENCVIGSEGWPFQNALTVVARHGETDTATIMQVVGELSGPQVLRIYTADFEHVVLPQPLVSADEINREYAGFSDLQDKYTTQEWKSLLGGLAAANPVPPIGAFWREMLPKGAEWPIDRVGLVTAFMLVCALANKATACAYRVTARMRNGYGKPSLKKHTRGRPELILASFDRVYHQVKSNNGDGCMREPHGRDGHYRYFWKRAGLNRLALPPRAVDRMALVFSRGVQNVYVNPCWVGPRTWGDGDGDYEIHVGPETG